jgi:hypothetical protein
MESQIRNTWIAVGALFAIGIVALLLVIRILFANPSIEVPVIVVDGTPQSFADAADGAVLK